MKVLSLIGLLSILIYTNVFASEGWVRVPVQGIQETELEGIFEVISSEQFTKVKLDCLSFIHGMNFYDKNQSSDLELTYSFPLSEPECGEIYQFIKKNLDAGKAACVELNVVEERYQLSEKDESCRLGS